jgi:hypothetical protein
MDSRAVVMGMGRGAMAMETVMVDLMETETMVTGVVMVEVIMAMGRAMEARTAVTRIMEARQWLMRGARLMMIRVILHRRLPQLLCLR